MRTIDITPTWRGILPWLVEIAANGESVEGRAAAMAELLKLADIIDKLCAEKASEEKASAVVERAQGEGDESWPQILDVSADRRAEDRSCSTS